ncbi:MAG TPA: prolipoprotein diacylglyceryl transferase, partial [Anaerolineales bacterium]|nr:prolipoprotein diacylglyceryl transferase [Anaerolineales bacterium]
MFTISIDPIIFNIGHFALRWYSLILMLAIAVGVWLVARESERKGFKKEDIYDAAVWIIVGGLIGARLFHVLDHWSHEYAANPIRALYIWEGGLAIWGAVIGGGIALALFAGRHGLHFGRLVDTATPGLVLGQALGRFAC